MKLRIKKHSIKRVTWTLFMFMLIFGPKIVPYPQLFLAVFSVLLLITEYRSVAKSVMILSGASRWGLDMAIWLVYSFTIPILGSLIAGDIVNIENYTQTINRYGMLMVSVIPCTCAFLSYLKKSKLSFGYFIECIIGAGLLESLCSILAFISPTIKNFFISIMGRSGGYLYSNTWYTTVRAYGFASTLVDLFGLGIAIIACVSYIYGAIYKRRYIIYSTIIAFATVLNSRTGLILYAICIICSTIFFLRSKRIKTITTAIAALMIIIAVALIVISVLASRSSTFRWVSSGVNSFFSAASSRDVNTLTLFSRSNWELPDPVRIIIGTGHSLYGAEGYRQSDTGYMNELWISGIVGCAWLYWSQIKLALRAIRSKIDFFVISAILILVCYFVFNIKGAALGYNPGGAAMISILFGMRYYLCQSDERMQEKSKYA